MTSKVFPLNNYICIQPAQASVTDRWDVMAPCLRQPAAAAAASPVPRLTAERAATLFHLYYKVDGDFSDSLMP